MSARFFQIDWKHDLHEDPIQFLYEMQSDKAITRMVETFRGGKSIADSLEIAAVREPNLVNNICLCEGGFDPDDKDNAYSNSNEFEFKEIDFDIFEAAFVNAQPNI